MCKDDFVAERYNLTAKQLQALELILMGKTVTEAAAEIGVARETVSRWSNHDPAFQAAYNAAMKSEWSAAQVTLLEARRRAAEMLLGMIDSEDLKLVFKVCEVLIKLDITEPKGQVDPFEIEIMQ